MRRLVIRVGAYELSIWFRISDTAEFVRVKDHLKQLTPARWDADEKSWVVPMSLIAGVKEWARQHFLPEEVTYIAAPPTPPRMGSALQRAYNTLYVLPEAPTPVIVASYRALSKLHHPDTGQGDHAAMAAINHAMDEIRKVRE